MDSGVAYLEHQKPPSSKGERREVRGSFDPGRAGVVHCLAQSTEGFRTHVEPLLARDGFFSQLDGARRENQNESAQEPEESG